MADVVQGESELGMLTNERTRLAVWGDPIAHSRSPQLHGAAYMALGLPWSYGRRQVDEAGFSDALASLSGDWRGLSLTMPLKGAAFGGAVTRDLRAELTGAVNTLLLTEDGPHGFNTDIGGIVEALREAGVGGVERGRIVGAGATATSALVALAELGAREVTVLARRPEAVEALAAIGRSIEVDVVAASIDAFAKTTVHRDSAAQVTIATLPGGTILPARTADAIAADGGVLLDAVYGHWPTSLAEAWARVGSTAMSGQGMLLHQALIQVRIFVTGDPNATLDDEAAVLATMRRSLMGD